MNCQDTMKILFTLFLLLTILIAPHISFAAKIIGPEFRVNEKSIEVSVSLTLDEGQIGLIRDGIPQELAFYIDLFRKWDIWPDEYVHGKRIKRIINADTIKGEFIARSFNGESHEKKRFSSFESMLEWALTIRDLPLPHNHLPVDGVYFIRVTVESHKRTLPKMIGYVLFFVNDRDFKIMRDSKSFRLRRK